MNKNEIIPGIKPWGLLFHLSKSIAKQVIISNYNYNLRKYIKYEIFYWYDLWQNCYLKEVGEIKHLHKSYKMYSTPNSVTINQSSCFEKYYPFK